MRCLLPPPCLPPGLPSLQVLLDESSRRLTCGFSAAPGPAPCRDSNSLSSPPVSNGPGSFTGPPSLFSVPGTLRVPGLSEQQTTDHGSVMRAGALSGSGPQLCSCHQRWACKTTPISAFDARQLSTHENKQGSGCHFSPSVGTRPNLVFELAL